ncbi:hypothetical protein GCM10009850_006170 [Nonomuraea monospora]|uniref:HicA-like toxin n=1 Tax=Nonomuraea monospora TaxID=568818 RepID=A0ABP5NZH5_9ACTN
MVRPRHPIKELEEVLAAAERKGWSVSKGKKYYSMKCPCGSHMKTVKCTPSGNNYRRNLLAQLGRVTCWNDEETP